jgi:hypothetical protein
MERSPFQATSLDLALLDFYLFGKIKMALIGTESKNEQELLNDVPGVIGAISRGELESFLKNGYRD